MNCTCRTSLYTLAAADAFFVIDVRRIVFDLDRIVFTSLLAFHTADTADLAFLSGERALVVVLAKHRRFGFIQRHKLD